MGCVAPGEEEEDETAADEESRYCGRRQSDAVLFRDGCGSFG